MAGKSAAEKVKEAAEKARKERERQREIERVNAINNQIANNNATITAYRGWETSLNGIKSDMQGAIDSWKDAKTKFSKCHIAKNVEVKNVFEGTAAASVKSKNGIKIAEVDAIIGKAEDVMKEIGKQADNISGKITELETENTRLQGQL